MIDCNISLLLVKHWISCRSLVYNLDVRHLRYNLKPYRKRIQSLCTLEQDEATGLGYALQSDIIS